MKTKRTWGSCLCSSTAPPMGSPGPQLEGTGLTMAGSRNSAGTLTWLATSGELGAMRTETTQDGDQGDQDDKDDRDDLTEFILCPGHFLHQLLISLTGNGYLNR